MVGTVNEPEVDRLIGQRIQFLRTQMRGLSQGDLATRLRDEGVNWAQGTLSKVENGDRPVRLSEGPIVADVLGIDLGMLLADGDTLDGLLKQARRDEAAARSALTQAQGQVALAACRHQYLRLLTELAGPHPAEQYVVVGSGPTGFLGSGAARACPTGALTCPIWPAN